MRRVLIGTLLVTQTLVLAAAFGVALRAADGALGNSPLAPRCLLPASTAAIARDLRNEALRIALHAGFMRREIRRVAARANPAPTMVASRARTRTGG